MREELQNIRKSIMSDTLGVVIARLSALAERHHLSNILTDITRVDEDYRLMKQYMLMGYADDSRSELIRKMKCKVYAISSQMLQMVHVNENQSYKKQYDFARNHSVDYGEVAERLQCYQQDIAISALDSDNKEKVHRSCLELHNYRELLFAKIMTSVPFTDVEADEVQSLLLSSVVDTIDRQLIVSALMLCQLFVWDPRKFRILCVTSGCQDEKVSEYALVGMVLTLPEKSDSINESIYADSLSELLGHEESLRRLADLQIQLFMTKNTGKIDDMIRTQIMPTLRKNADRMMQRHSKDDELDIEAIINPNMEEKEMDEMENIVGRMRKMQNLGADVFYGGFSQAKRSIFFYTLINWFYPFYIQHPQLSLKSLDVYMLKRIEQIVNAQPMCNSDKYSFVTSIASTINLLPKYIKEVLESDSIPIVDMNEKTESGSLIRQMLLGDYYRFFNLYSKKNDFIDVFSDIERVSFITNMLIMPFMEKTRFPQVICKQLLKLGDYEALERVIDCYGRNGDVGFKRIKGMMEYNRHHFKEAYSLLLESWDGVEMNVPLLKKIAWSAYQAGYYLEAENLYAQLMEVDDKREAVDEYAFSHALCLMKNGMYESASNELYRLYLDADRPEYRKAIAKCCIIQSKPDEALRMLEGIDSELVDEEYYWTKAIALLMNGRIADAIIELQQWRKMTGTDIHDFMDKLVNDIVDLDMLDSNRISAEVIADMLYDENASSATTVSF